MPHINIPPIIECGVRPEPSFFIWIELIIIQYKLLRTSSSISFFFLFLYFNRTWFLSYFIWIKSSQPIALGRTDPTASHVFTYEPKFFFLFNLNRTDHYLVWVLLIPNQLAQFFLLLRLNRTGISLFSVEPNWIRLSSILTWTVPLPFTSVLTFIYRQDESYPSASLLLWSFPLLLSLFSISSPTIYPSHPSYYTSRRLAGVFIFLLDRNH